MAVQPDAMAVQANAMAVQADAMAVQLDAMAVQANAMAVQADAMAVQPNAMALPPDTMALDLLQKSLIPHPQALGGEFDVSQRRGGVLFLIYARSLLSAKAYFCKAATVTIFKQTYMFNFKNVC
ncbi:hypothetical protein [Nostoc sp.]|uniref:hypothetical protein n=1 Tax=Nostoc sp. TaxID=1180 RepID=UPI002FFCEB1D